MFIFCTAQLGFSVLSNSEEDLRTIVQSRRYTKKSCGKYKKNYLEGIKYGNLTPSPPTLKVCS